MNLEQKTALVEELTEKLKGASGIYLTDFVGLNVKAITQLRARLRKQGFEYVVVKNTLAERAVTELKLPDVTAHFRGPTGLVISTKDPVGPARVLTDFAKENDSRPAVKAAIVERRAMSAAEVQRLAALPSREVLLALLAGALEAPMSQFAYTLQAKLIEMGALLEALRAAREG